MRSIGLKLWSGMMILVMVVLLLLWFFQIVFLEKFYTSMQISETKNAGRSVIEGITSLTQPDIGQILDGFSFNNNLSLELVDNSGKTVYENIMGGWGNSNGQMMRNNVRREAFARVIKNEEISEPLVHPRFGNQYMLIGLPISKSGQVLGALFINMPLAPVQDTASILKHQLIYITVILLLGASLLSFFISRNFTKPILNIKKVSEKMAQGNFSDRIQIKGKDEVSQLAETINHMGSELAKIEQLRKDLIANVSHELRTPLSLIRGYAETIRDVSGNVPDKREKQLEVIIEESERLGRIVDDMLNLSQIQAGYINLNLTNFSLTDLAEHIVEKYAILSEKTGVSILAVYSHELYVKADQTRLEQALYNLINNAFNHTGVGGTIKLNIFDDDKFIKVEVTDNGIGIPEEHLLHIWGRYYKTESSISRKRVGTGLGLAIVKSILEAHNALLGVESKPGIGTRFWFALKK